MYTAEEHDWAKLYYLISSNIPIYDRFKKPKPSWTKSTFLWEPCKPLVHMKIQLLNPVCHLLWDTLWWKNKILLLCPHSPVWKASSKFCFLFSGTSFVQWKCFTQLIVQSASIQSHSFHFLKKATKFLFTLNKETSCGWAVLSSDSTGLAYWVWSKPSWLVITCSIGLVLTWIALTWRICHT